MEGTITFLMYIQHFLKKINSWIFKVRWLLGFQNQLHKIDYFNNVAKNVLDTLW